MTRVHRTLLVVGLLAGSARADSLVPPQEARMAEPTRPPFELQADLGLAVIGIGIEHAVAPQLAVAAEVFTTGTYFLPWFSLGPNAQGFGAGVRLTWLEHAATRGLYGVALLRFSGVSTDGSDTFLMTEVGLAAGYAFPLTRKLDLRLGLGVIAFHGAGTVHATGMSGPTNVGAPFAQLDAVLGYRL